MMASYTASLAAHLVTRDVIADVNGLEQLKSRGGRLCVQSATAYSKSFKQDASLRPLLLEFESIPKMVKALMVDKRCSAMAHLGASVSSLACCAPASESPAWRPAVIPGFPGRSPLRS